MQSENQKEVIIFHDDKKISQAIITLMESNIGYSVNCDGLLLIRHLDDLTFAVSHEKYNLETRKCEFNFEKIFEDAKEATKYFLQKRVEYELGADFEIEPESRLK